MADGRSLYDDDFPGWAFEQANRLRLQNGLASAGIDVELIAEEIEDLGRSEINRIHSLITQALAHLLKIVSSHEAAPVKHWSGEIVSFMVQVKRSWSPGLRQRIDMQAAWEDAQQIAKAALDAYGEEMVKVPETCPVSIDEILSVALTSEVFLTRIAQIEIEPGRS